jgi:hypothetical protein
MAVDEVGYICSFLKQCCCLYLLSLCVDEASFTTHFFIITEFSVRKILSVDLLVLMSFLIYEFTMFVHISQSESQLPMIRVSKPRIQYVYLNKIMSFICTIFPLPDTCGVQR